MKDLGHDPFIFDYSEQEPVVTQPVPSDLVEMYARNDAERAQNAGPNMTLQVVYDSIEPSPYYDGENSKYGPYIDERDFIELPNPSDSSNGQINEPYQKKYYFNPQNLPYTLEQSTQYSQAPQNGGQGRRNAVPRLNRYYEKLKPYYHIDMDIADKEV